VTRDRPIDELLAGYNPDTPLTEACTPPSAWYRHQGFANEEARRVFAGGWQIVKG
jgi:choline monooxygenase